jgi:hypothetical protein
VAGWQNALPSSLTEALPPCRSLPAGDWYNALLPVLNKIRLQAGSYPWPGFIAKAIIDKAQFEQLVCSDETYPP